MRLLPVAFGVRERCPLRIHEGPAMFDVFCTDCSRRQLVFPGQVLGIRNDERGIQVVFRCSRGHVGVVLTGRAAEPTAA